MYDQTYEVISVPPVSYDVIYLPNSFFKSRRKFCKVDGE